MIPKRWRQEEIYLPPSFRNSLFKAYKRYKLYLLCRFEYKLN